MTFDREPKEVAESDSLDLDFYKPSEFVNSALQQSKVNLTWDEDDPDRIKNTKGSFNKEELEKADFKAYLASSSEEDDSEGGKLKLTWHFSRCGYHGDLLAYKPELVFQDALVWNYGVGLLQW